MESSKNSRPQLGLLEQLGVHALLRHWKLLFFVTLVTPAVAVMAHRMIPPSYASEAKILVKLGREFMGPTTQSGRSSSMYRLNEAINSEIEILRSRELAREVITSMGLETLYPLIPDEQEHVPHAMDEKGIATLQESFSASGVIESSVIRVALSHTDPRLAQAALTTLVGRFQAKHLDVFSIRMLSTTDGGVEAAKLALRAAEDTLNTYREENRVFDTKEERTLLLRRRDDLQNQIVEAQGERARLFANRTTDDQDSDLFRQETMDISLLQAEERKLLEHYYPHSDAVRTIRAQIEVRESIALKRRASREEALLADERRREQALFADEKRWEQALEVTGQGLLQLEANELALRGLGRAVQFQEALLLKAQEAHQIATLDAKLNAEEDTSIVVIDSPSLPLDPIGVGLIAKIVAGALAGFLIGVSLVILLNMLDRGRELQMVEPLS
ncbi:MAG: hypothetical protein GY930_19150 [bacterium]|nr:hypothetical protein [bacterium]